MRNKHILFVLLGAFCLAIPVSAQKNAVKVKKIKTSVNADSLEVRKLIDAAKKGDAESQNTLGTYYYAGKKAEACQGYRKHGALLSIRAWNQERFIDGSETLQGIHQGR